MLTGVPQIDLDFLAASPDLGGRVLDPDGGRWFLALAAGLLVDYVVEVGGLAHSQVAHEDD